MNAIARFAVVVGCLALASVGCSKDDDKPHHRHHDDDDDDDDVHDASPSTGGTGLVEGLLCKAGLCSSASPEVACKRAMSLVMADLGTFDGGAGFESKMAEECLVSLKKLQAKDPRGYGCLCDCAAKATVMKDLERCNTTCGVKF